MARVFWVFAAFLAIYQQQGCGGDGEEEVDTDTTKAPAAATPAPTAAAAAATPAPTAAATPAPTAAATPAPTTATSSTVAADAACYNANGMHQIVCASAGATEAGCTGTWMASCSAAGYGCCAPAVDTGYGYGYI